jgi:hypothetical protein
VERDLRSGEWDGVDEHGPTRTGTDTVDRVDPVDPVDIVDPVDGMDRMDEMDRLGRVDGVDLMGGIYGDSPRHVSSAVSVAVDGAAYMLSA